jgi:acyl-CoA thioester hydrolase
LKSAGRFGRVNKRRESGAAIVTRRALLCYNFRFTDQISMLDFYETTVRVRYAETDQMGVVYHANYYIWFEIGRVELLRQLGFSYKDMEVKDDCYIVVGETKCRHLRPARYDDVLRIRTRVAEAGTRTIRFAYEVLNDATGERIATGETMHVVCDRNGRPKQIPVRYRVAFGVHLPDQTAAN